MSINPDIEETRIFLKLAREFVRLCDLEDTTYGDKDHYTLLHIYARTMPGLSVKYLMENFPCLCDAMSAADNQFRRFDWPSLAIAVDHVRGKSVFGFESS